MNYYYDVILNFQDLYYMFYEWDELDSVDLIKKIPLFRIEQNVYEDLLSSNIKVNSEFLKTIENKTKLKTNDIIKYAAIFSDGKNSIALEFNDNGEVINKSSLMLEDEININEFLYSIELSNIDYKVLSKVLINNETRQEAKIKKLLKIEVLNMYEKKDYNKLRYIYLEWFNELNNDIESMYQKMINRINKSITNKEYKIYELIKFTYNV